MLFFSLIAMLLRVEPANTPRPIPITINRKQSLSLDSELDLLGGGGTDAKEVLIVSSAEIKSCESEWPSGFDAKCLLLGISLLNLFQLVEATL